MSSMPGWLDNKPTVARELAAFCDERGWRLKGNFDRITLALGMCHNGGRRSRNREQPRDIGDCGGLFDHELRFRSLRHPYWPTAIMSFSYAGRRARRQYAAATHEGRPLSELLRMEVLDLKWYGAGTACLLFTPTGGDYGSRYGRAR